VVGHVHILVRFLVGREVSEGNGRAWYSMLSKWKAETGSAAHGLPERLRVAWYRGD
jgi:hypothetical protein